MFISVWFYLYQQMLVDFSVPHSHFIWRSHAEKIDYMETPRALIDVTSVEVGFHDGVRTVPAANPQSAYLGLSEG